MGILEEIIEGDKKVEKESIYGLTREQLGEQFLEWGEKKFRADQVWQWLYRKRVSSFQEMTNLSDALRQRMEEHFTFSPLKEVVCNEQKIKQRSFYSN